MIRIAIGVALGFLLAYFALSCWVRFGVWRHMREVNKRLVRLDVPATAPPASYRPDAPEVGYDQAGVAISSMSGAERNLYPWGLRLLAAFALFYIACMVDVGAMIVIGRLFGQN